MTLAELERAVKSWERKKKTEQQEIAIHNYILAGLIGNSVASYFSNGIEMPKVEEVYSNLFADKAEETKQSKEELKTELSVARFKQFANLHNTNYKQQEVANNLNE